MTDPTTAAGEKFDALFFRLEPMVLQTLYEIQNGDHSYHLIDELSEDDVGFVTVRLMVMVAGLRRDIARLGGWPLESWPAR